MHHHTLYNRISSRLLALALAAVLVLCMLPAASAAEFEGVCGRDLEWSFTDGTLTITGSGDMADYTTLESIPWYSLRDRILRLELPEGLTRVGDMAFYGCTRLTSVTIPASVKTIGKLAFCHCTGLSILRLQSGLQTIGESAFEMCGSLQDLRLPSTVTRLDRQAFYGCASLASVTVPETVRDMGSGVFAHCVSLIRAKIQAPLETLPRWTFYGCTSLTSIELPPQTKSVGRYCVYGCTSLSVIYYGGEPGDAGELMDQIREDHADFGSFGTITEEPPADSETSYDVETDENGDVIAENTTVTETEDATVTVTEKENVTDPDAEELPTDISATVVEKEGWDQVVDAVEDALKDGGSVEVDVFVATDAEVPDSVLEELTGKDVVMNVTTSTGATYTLDFTQVNYDKKVNGLDLSYRLARMNKEYPELGGAESYQLLFNKSCAVRARVKIQLPIEYARRVISLYQIERGTPRQLQAVVADENGVAHFFLASVDSKMVYLLGIDVPSVQQGEVLIPGSLENEYGITDKLSSVDYVVTGRVSSWGVTSGQVGRVLLGIMLSTAAFVGLLMYARNKRKIRQGFVPGWDDADDGE